MIEQQNKASSKYDGCLFLVRHLLILKEMTNTLDIGQGYVEPKLPVTGKCLIPTCHPNVSLKSVSRGALVYA
jgi:hypothetical protein